MKELPYIVKNIKSKDGHVYAQIVHKETGELAVSADIHYICKWLIEQAIKEKP